MQFVSHYIKRGRPNDKHQPANPPVTVNVGAEEKTPWNAAGVLFNIQHSVSAGDDFLGLDGYEGLFTPVMGIHCLIKWQQEYEFI